MTAEKAGLGTRHFQDIESGRRHGVRLETVERIAKVLRNSRTGSGFGVWS